MRTYKKLLSCPNDFSTKIVHRPWRGHSCLPCRDSSRHSSSRFRNHRDSLLAAPLIAIMLLASCESRLPSSLRREISIENERLQTAELQVDKSESALNNNLAQAPELFRGAAEAAAWKSDIAEAKADLQTSRNDARKLAQLADRDRPDNNIARLLADESRLRNAALGKVQFVDQSMAKWLDYKHDPAGFAAKVDRERETIRAFDLSSVTTAVGRAEQDWPAKKPALESRLSSLVDATRKTEAPSQGAPSILIAEESAFSQETAALSRNSQELQSECGELYDSWDKILTDLDHSKFGADDALFRERIKTVRTHFIDVPLKKTETHSEEHWTDVSEASFHQVENDLGMAIAHKDAGQFDSEAQTTPQPAGFSYVASPSVGSNQYGYWTHTGGESLWTFLPQYLILRELLWNHDYRPVAAGEYNAYRTAQSRGATYYGRDTTTAALKYGSHGTFTQQHYADSRYVQSGAFKGSAYASNHNSNSGPSLWEKAPREPAAAAQSGKRFGRQPSSPPLGQRFGRSPGSRPAGRSFGRRH